MSSPILDLPQTQAWSQHAPGALDALTSALQNLHIHDAGIGPNHQLQIFQETVVNRFNTPNPDYPKNTANTVKAFIDLAKYTLKETQQQLFETTGRLLNTANDLETTQNQLVRTTNNLNALAQRMPSGRLLGTVAVSLLIAGALISRLATQYFPVASDALQNEDDCNEKLSMLHKEYTTIERLGQECINKRKEANEKLTTCANIIRELQNKKA